MWIPRRGSWWRLNVTTQLHLAFDCESHMHTAPQQRISGLTTMLLLQYDVLFFREQDSRIANSDTVNATGTCLE